MNKKLLLYGLIAIVIVVLAIFANYRNGERFCKGVHIDISYSDATQLTDTADIALILQQTYDDITTKQLKQIDLAALQHAILDKNPYLLNATANQTLSGWISLQIVQRTPIALLYTNKKGISNPTYYIDDTGMLLPVRLSPQKTPILSRLLPINGNTAQFITDTVALRNLYHILQLINTNATYQALIGQIYITNNNDICAITEIAPETIINFGSFDSFDKKLKTLTAFIDRQLKTANAPTYSQINLKYRNQIVCTK